MGTPKILIVGGGLTGCATNHFLSTLIPTAIIYLWEKESNLGGRMSTEYYKIRDRSYQCDMGAQYITRESEEFSDVYSVLTDEDILKPLMPSAIFGMKPAQASKSQYVAPQGIQSIVSKLGSNAVLSLNKPLSQLKLSSSGNKLIAYSSNDVSTSQQSPGEEFDAVIFTINAIQLSNFLQSNSDQRIQHIFDSSSAFKGTLSEETASSFRNRLHNVNYSTRYALACYFPPMSWTVLDSLHVPWTAYFTPSTSTSPLRYISIESRKAYCGDLIEEKRNRRCELIGGYDEDEDGDKATSTTNTTTTTTTSRGLSILLHSSIPFALHHISIEQQKRKQQQQLTLLSQQESSNNTPNLQDKEEEKEESEISQILLNELNQIIPGLGSPDATHLHLWTESQVSKGMTCPGGEKALVFQDKDLSQVVVGVAGDMFTESNFEGCLRSAKVVATEISKILLELR